jgi:hypothetical protein
MTVHALPAWGTSAIVHAAGWGALAVALSLAGASAAAQSRSDIRPGELLEMDRLALTRFLEESRPAPVSAEVKAQVLARLPKRGIVEALDGRARQKLAALGPFLEAVDRSSAYDIKVIDVPEAFIGLHERTVLLISLPALRLVSENELRAVVAHEVAHEYVHAEYTRATAAGRRDQLQDLELVCDIIAVLTLNAIGQEAAWSLSTAIEKLTRFNHARFGSELHHPDYPTSLLRRSVMLALEKKLSGAAKPR